MKHRSRLMCRAWVLLTDTYPLGKPVVSVAILAGGHSKRMGQDKAFLAVNGQQVIDRIIQRVSPLSNDVLISTNRPTQYAEFGLRLVPDVYPDKAALGGIYSVIAAAQHPRVVVVACDMPFLNTNLLQYLIDVAPAADVVAPLIAPPHPETMHTIYHKRCLPAIEPRLQADKLRVTGFFDAVSVRYVLPTEIIPFDPHFHAFTNINTPQAYEQARFLAAQIG